MVRLEELGLGVVVKGILPDVLSTVVAVSWVGSVVLELICKEAWSAQSIY